MGSTTPIEGPGGHISHAPLVTPILDGSTPSAKQIRNRIHAFRIRLGRIGGFSDEEIVGWLEEQGWDIDVAEEYFIQVTLQHARADHESNRPGRSVEQQWQDSMLAAASYSRHQNHRRSIRVLFETITATHADDKPTALRLAYLLRDTMFDLHTALENHENRRLGVNDMAEVDRAERRLCMLAPGAAEPNDVHKDTRLRDFLEIAGTDDWVSAKAFLISHNWHLGVAIDAWMQGGFPRTSPTDRDSTKRAGYREPRDFHIETDNMWPAGRPLFAVTTIDAADLADAATDYGTDPYNFVGESARYINLDLEPAPAGIFRRDKLYHEYISRGKGVYHVLHTAVTECGVDIEGANWYNTEHVSAVNKAYNQNPHRKGGVRKKGAPILYAPGEDTWIYNWHQGRVTQYQTNNPGFVLPADQTWKDCADFSLSDLHTDFNNHFQGKTIAGFTGPHPGRDMESLKTKRTRMQNLCDAFGFKYSPPR